MTAYCFVESPDIQERKLIVWADEGWKWMSHREGEENEEV
jgi:hypothetical protein